MQNISSSNKVLKNLKNKNKNQEPESFLQRFFNSKEFIFPQLDQDLINKRMFSFQLLSQNYQRIINDFRAWILNSYPLSSFFKNIILKNNIQILKTCECTKNRHQINKRIYIGQTNFKLKHGYGLQIIIFKSLSNNQIDNTQKFQLSKSQFEFEAYEGFFVNNLRHGRGKYYSNYVRSKIPNFYSGNFSNNFSNDNKISLMIWKNNDIYIGKAKQGFQKCEKGILYISKKNVNNKCSELSLNKINLIRLNIQKDALYFQKIIVSEWQGDITKTKQKMSINKKMQNETKDQQFDGDYEERNVSEAKIIMTDQFYVGSAYTYFSRSLYSHACIKQGPGLLKYRNGDVYQGSFLLDAFHGYGSYTWINSNSHYIGQFLNGSRNGTGYWKNNSINDEYQGEYQDNKKQGNGQYRWGNGNLYKGQFKNDLRDGMGRMYWNTGQVYKGEWKNGLQNGIGSLYYKNRGNEELVREAVFANGIQMQTGSSKFEFKNYFLQSPKGKEIRNQSTSFSKYKFINEQQFNKVSLPKINETKIKNLKNFIKQKCELEGVQLSSQQLQKKAMIKRQTRSNSLKQQVPFHSLKKQLQRSLDYTKTRKLPYYNSSNKIKNHTEKIQKDKISSLAYGDNLTLKQKKVYNLNSQENKKKEGELTRIKDKNIFTQAFNEEQSESQERASKNSKNFKSFLADSLMLPIKWKNIKRSNFIMFQKQKNRKAKKIYQN